MGQPFVGECRLVGFSFPPAGWAQCAGQLMAISENEVLFQLIGTTYGGDGQSTFAMPDLQGRVPIHQGTGVGGVPFTIGQKAGVESVTLTANQIPIHNHALIASSGNGNTNLLQGTLLSTNATKVYNAVSPAPGAIMSSNSITAVGGSLPHENLQPYLTMNWVISLFGIFPSQT